MTLCSIELDLVCQPLLNNGWGFTINGPAHHVMVIAWWSLEKLRRRKPTDKVRR